jgi:hypothetical protein
MVRHEGGAPEWISYYEECDIDLVGVFQDVVAGRFDHFAVGDDDFAPIERFLLSRRSEPSLSVVSHATTHKHIFLDQQDRRVRLKVHALGLLDDLQALDRHVLLIRQAETHEIQHVAGCCLPSQSVLLVVVLSKITKVW